MSFEVILVGGGLQSALIALALLRRSPHARVALVESAERLGGNHTWSFYETDLSPKMRDVVEPLVTHRWPGYEVSFPGLQRAFSTPYASISSERLHQVVQKAFESAPHSTLLLGHSAVEVQAGAVVLSNGECLQATHVIDSRGPLVPENAGEVAYQKFVGLEVELQRPGVRTLPCVMDARVEQLDGYRFVYTLPLTRTRWLVEDTYYSDDASLDEPLLTRRVLDYAKEQALDVKQVIRVEKGVLPLPLRPLAASASEHSVHVGGYRGGWLHPTTGYSLPVAARLAELWARSWPSAPSQEARARILEWRDQQYRFLVLLNRLLFRACVPEERWRVLERFHRLAAGTVERFYAMQTRPLDRARILFGVPPRGIRWGQAFAEMAAAVRMT